MEFHSEYTLFYSNKKTNYADTNFLYILFCAFYIFCFALQNYITLNSHSIIQQETNNNNKYSKERIDTKCQQRE